jgi:hypothetical protein
MKGPACTLLVAVLLAGLVLADDPPETATVDPLQQFQRDQELIRSLVEGGLRLAGEEDSLARARTCTTLAEQLSREIQQAAREQDRPRVTFLSNHLESLLVRGVASNAERVRSAMPAHANQKKALEDLVTALDRATAPADEGLKQLATAANDFRILRPLQQGRARVDRAVHGDGAGFVPTESKKK